MDVSNFDDVKKKRTAVAYLLTHMEEAPAGTEKLFNKLKQLEKSANENVKTFKNAEETIKGLQEQMNGIIGATNAIVEIVCGELPEEKIVEWCEKYQPPQMNMQPVNAPQIKNQSPDMAGITAKTLPPINPPKR
jgi:hypothetical protein